MELVSDHLSNMLTAVHHPMVMAECLQGNLQCSGTGGTNGDESVTIIKAYRGYESFVNVLGMALTFIVIITAGFSFAAVTFFYYFIVFWLVLFSIILTTMPPSMLIDEMKLIILPYELNTVLG